MKILATTIAIAAPGDKVWALLTDAAGYPAWNSTIEKVDGRIALGKKVKVYAKLSPKRAHRVRVTELESPVRMVWTGGMPFGLFTGTRIFSLIPIPIGVVFAMQEAYVGLMAGLLTRLMPDVQRVFDAFAADLKRAAEEAQQPERSCVGKTDH